MPHRDHESMPFDTEQRDRRSGASPFIFGQQPTRESIFENDIGTPVHTNTLLKGGSQEPLDSHRGSDPDVTRISIPVQKVREGGHNRFPVFPPNHVLRDAWSISYDILILYSLCTSTYYLAFEHPGTGLFGFDIFVWVFFIVDVFVTFNTGYLDEDAHVVTSRRSIAFRYLSTWFFIDIIALLPFSFGGYPEVEYYLRLLRFLRLPDSVNFVDGTGVGALFSMVFKYLPEIEVGNFAVSYYYISLAFQQICRMIVWSYFLACIFYWYAKHTGPEKVYTDLWFDDSAKLEGEPADIKLLKAWYYMMTTLVTIGYGDLLPLSFCERILVIFILVIGIANFSLIMGSFVSIISEINSMNSSSDIVDQASVWMDSIENAGHKISPSLKNRILLYYRAYFSLDRLGSLSGSWWLADSPEDLGTSGDSLFNDLPENLQKSLLNFLYSDVIMRYGAFFAPAQCSFAYTIAFHFQPHIYPAGDCLLEEGEEVTDVLLLTKGRVACEFQVGAEHHQFLFFDEFLVLGDYFLLTKTHSQFTFRGLEPVRIQTLAIPAKAFLDVMELFNAPTEKGYSHKKEWFKRSALFMNTIRNAKQMYIKRSGLEQTANRPGLTGMSTLLTKFVNKDPTKQYSDSKAKQEEYYSTAKLLIERFEARIRSRKSLHSRLHYQRESEPSEAPDNTQQSFAA